MCPIRHIKDKTFSLLFPGVQVSNEYEALNQKIVSVRALFYKVDEEKGEVIEHKFEIVNLNDWAWCYTLKHKDEIMHYECRPK